MSIETLFKDRIIENPISKFKKELTEIVNNSLTKKIFSQNELKKEVAQLGLDLLKLKDNYSQTYVSLGDSKCSDFETKFSENVWDAPEYFKLLVYFFGEKTAPMVKAAWEQLPKKMYQTGYQRRSFRAPNNKRYLLVNQINFLRSLVVKPHLYNYQKNVYFDLTLEEQIRYDNTLSLSTNQFMLWSAALDLGDTALFELFEAIVFNSDPIGKVSRNIIKALLNSDQKKCWELVEKLLLAAQRQEGLRQTVLEALDETSIGALEFMIDVIVQNKLTRFSSVIRAIDTWTGLGWESEKETTVRNIISLAQQFFANPELIATAIKSKNNNEVYMALWVQGIIDVEKTVPYLHELVEKGSIEKKCLAIKFAGETQDPYIEMPLYHKTLADENLQVLAFALPRMTMLLSANIKTAYFIDNDDYPDFFEKNYALSQSITVKEKTFENKVFSWITVKFERDMLFASAINLMGDNDERLQKILSHFETISIELRTKLTQQILGDYYCYSYYSMDDNAKKEKTPPTDFQKQFALRILKDRGESMVASAICTLEAVVLGTTEMELFQELLKRKNATLKKNLIRLIILQNENLIENFVEQTIQNGDAEQRMAALDVILQLKNTKKLPEKVNSWIADYKQRPKITERETKFLEQLTPTKGENTLSAENGFGYYDPTFYSEYALPKPDVNGLFLSSIAKENYGFSKPYSAIKDALNKLYLLFDTHKNYEYEVEYNNNSKETLLLGNDFTPIKVLPKTATKDEIAENYPLANVWFEWFEQSGLDAKDLFLLTLASRFNTKDWSNFLNKHIFYHEKELPNPNKSGYYWNNPILSILKAVQLKYVFEQKQDFLIDACSYLYAQLPLSILEFKYKPKKDEYYYKSDKGDGWQNQNDLDIFLHAITQDNLNTDQKIKVWQLYRWRQLTGLPVNRAYCKPPMYLYCIAFAENKITKGELYEGILDSERISILTSGRKHYQHFGSENITKEFQFLQPMIDEIRNTFLDIELKRGDTNTTVTHLTQSFQKIYGSNRFEALLTGLGKSNLYKGYIYSWGYTDLTKQKLFSYLLKRAYPLETDTQTDFNTLITNAKITEERLIQAAIYAPQWQKLISSCLNWKGLDEGIWWFHAHTKTATYGEQNVELESEVSKYSAIELQDFKDGAVDKDWFISAYKKLGKTKWETLYEAAKFVTDGNGHRRARLYADTLTGDLKIREVTTKVKDKRDQDYLRVYGLVPLSKSNAEKDILSRYEYLQQFKKESKEFGSMKQTSEALAIRIALENLARNAGYPDPVRLTWAMETQQVQKILSNETEVTIDGITVGLMIDKEGKAELTTFKDGKELKAIPAKIKKDAAIIELGKHRKIMREQWTRSKKGLEEAMIRGDEFMYHEMKNLFEHPVISKHLQKLVFISNTQQIGFFVNQSLVSAQGEIIDLTEDQTFRLAHCFDLHNNKLWTDFQTYCFENKLKQPFKQIFRELYVPTPDELNEKSISRRYAGHQVQPKQTLALLKNRGWKVDYEEGLQKVFHKERYQVKMYAMADWFSPADIESPTLETIEFHSLKDYKNIAFTDINPRIFSEVMRDIDLVVSVAHVGGVDPEASHSSIEMRTVLMRETLKLFKINNVEITQNHALIKGTLANYSVHLGSAIVHQVPGKYLSILPVHSQQRGRLFLPFADDDPKAAEVLSKVILLAKDKDIQDPTILSQIDQELVRL